VNPLYDGGRRKSSLTRFARQAEYRLHTGVYYCKVAKMQFNVVFVLFLKGVTKRQLGLPRSHPLRIEGNFRIF
jgi:hypothetical protein